MNVGIFFKHDRAGGGIYQYFLSLIDCARRWKRQDRFFVFHASDIGLISTDPSSRIRLVMLGEDGLNPPEACESGCDQTGYEVAYGDKKIVFRSRPLTPELTVAANRCRIDLMIYPTPEREAFEVGCPYIMAMHDVAHRILPQFAEFRAGGVYEQREYVYGKGIRNALYVLADSEVGRQQLISHYAARPEKVRVLPFIPPPYIGRDGEGGGVEEVRARYDLPEKFIFYPAQFWPHKNHENLIKALSIIRASKGEEISAVFVGSKQNKWDGFQNVGRLVDSLGIGGQILYLGYVVSEHIRALYEMATALVMPSFLGPTNLPILEAFATGCPVVASDIEGIRQQVGNAGILVDPNSPEEIADAIHRIWVDEELRNALARRGYRKDKEWSSEDFSNSLQTTVDMCRIDLSTGKQEGKSHASE